MKNIPGILLSDETHCKISFILSYPVSFHYALSFSYCIEISQLYQADWINAIRGTTLGALVLGHGFLWSDILCYTVGVGLAILIDFTLFINKEYI